jgi:GTPase SAR1 family protein
MYEDYDVNDTIECAIVGPVKSGKTSFIYSLTDDTYKPSPLKGYHPNKDSSWWSTPYDCPVTGYSYNIYDVNANPETLDGSEEFTLNLEGATCAIVVEDGDSKSPSVETEEYKELIRYINGDDFPILVVRSKCDDTKPCEVSQDGVVMTSARKGTNVKLALRILTDMVL